MGDTFSRPGVKGEEIIAWSLAFLASDKSFASHGDDWKRGAATVHKHFHRFVRAVNHHLLPMLFYFPRGARAIESAAGYQQMCSMPNIVVTIDGSHVPIKRPHASV